MPSMPLIQQKQPFPRPVKALLCRLAVPASCLIASALIVTITFLAGGIFGLLATFAFNLGLVIYLRDRWITRIFAASISAIILAISLAILFPVTVPVFFPLSGFAIAYSTTYATIKALQKGTCY